MIDVNNEEQVRAYKEKLKLLQDGINTNGYTEDNLKIIITANMFTNETVLPAGKEPYVYRNPNCSLGIVVRNRINKADGIDNYDEKQLITLKEQSEKYMPYSSKYVSVVYAAINGLYPDYFATNYIIVDNFKKHIDNKNLLSIRPESSLFTGEVKLSDEAVLLIDANKVNELKSKYPELEKMKVITFNGNPEEALAMYLVEIGIIPEKMNSQYVISSPTSEKFEQFLDEYSLKNSIPLSKYEELDFYDNDQKGTTLLQKIYESAFYDFLLKQLHIPDESYIELYKRLCDGDEYDEDNLIILDGIIDSLGAEGLTEIVNNFNSKIDAKIVSNSHPANDEILEIGKIELD